MKNMKIHGMKAKKPPIVAACSRKKDPRKKKRLGARIVKTIRKM
jgi:hypothetical protein